MKKQTNNTSKITKPTAKVIPITEFRVNCKYNDAGTLSWIEFTPESYVELVACYLWKLRNKKAVVDVRNELELCTYAKGWSKLNLGSHWKFDCALTVRNAMNVYFSLPCNRDRALLIPLLDELVGRYMNSVTFDLMNMQQRKLLDQIEQLPEAA